jgi:hypothetical protein
MRMEKWAVEQKQAGHQKLAGPMDEGLISLVPSSSIEPAKFELGLACSCSTIHFSKYSLLVTLMMEAVCTT